MIIKFAERSKIDCRTLGKAADAGDTFALGEIDRIARSFGIGLANILTLFHPERIVIGGGVSNLGELLLQPVRKYAEHYTFAPCRAFSILPCGFTEDAVLIGAAIVAAERMTGVKI
jgi:glucokinase